MREIKFRVWDKLTQSLHDDTRLCGMLNLKLQQENLVYLQYTGLKDNNGVEIYEGDVLRTQGFNIKVEAAPVITTHSGHGDCSFGGVTTWFGFWGNGSDIEVIGNIYENPELLDERS